MSPDGLSYTFLLRPNIKFHNGDPVTADDVKFSFERYKGGAAKLLKEKVEEVQVLDARRVKFVLREPWPDFMTFYGTTATGRGLDRPEEVRREGRRRRLQEGADRRRSLPVRQLHAGQSRSSSRRSRATGGRPRASSG